MKIRNCKKILLKYLGRRVDRRGQTHATPKDIKALKGMEKYRHNDDILYLIHPWKNYTDLWVWIGG